MKQSTHFAHVAKNLLTVLQGYTKGMRFTAILTLLLTLGIGNAWAGAGFWNDGGITLTFTVNSSSVTRTLNSGSQGGETSLGTVTTAMSLKSVKANVWKDGSGNICTVNMFYQVKNSSGTVVLDKSGTATALSWSSNDGNNQVWQNTNIGVDLMNGGLAPGTYTFECWFTATGNNSSSSGCGTTFWYSNNSNNYKYTFIIPSKKLTVAGAANGNTVSGSVTGITKGKAYTINANPTSGYSFSKWTASSGASSITIANANNASTTVTFKNYSSDATVTASFTAKTYTVTLDNQGATTAGQTSVTTTYNAAMPSIASNLPKKTGYTFNGYFDAVSGGTQYYNADGTSARTWNKTSNTTLYAQWKEQTFHLAGAMNGWSTTSNKMTISNGIATCTLSLAKGDYQFKIVESGETWRTASTTPRTITRTSNNLEFKTKDDGNDNNTKITADVEGTADYVFNYDIANEKLTVLYPTAYTITYGVGNTKGTESVTTNPSVTSGNLVLASTAITFSKGETKAGYTWKNWNSLADGSGTELGTDVTYVSANRAGDIAVYACYELVTYDIIYELDGGSGAENTTYNVETDVTLPTPTKTGHTFDGWYTTSDFSDDKVTEIKKGTTTGKKTFYAKWNAEIYDVKWYVNGVELTGDQLTGVSTKVEYGKSVKNIPSVDVSDYCGDKFVGWTTTSMDNVSEEAPQIYTDEFPTAEGAQTFYAVFADYKN